MIDVNAHHRPLRIVHSESSCGWGGQEIRILTESEGLARRGHDVEIVCPAEAPIYAAARRRGIDRPSPCRSSGEPPGAARPSAAG